MPVKWIEAFTSLVNKLNQTNALGCDLCFRPQEVHYFSEFDPPRWMCKECARRELVRLNEKG